MSQYRLAMKRSVVQHDKLPHSQSRWQELLKSRFYQHAIAVTFESERSQNMSMAPGLGVVQSVFDSGLIQANTISKGNLLYLLREELPLLACSLTI